MEGMGGILLGGGRRFGRECCPILLTDGAN